MGINQMEPCSSFDSGSGLQELYTKDRADNWQILNLFIFKRSSSPDNKKRENVLKYHTILQVQLIECTCWEVSVNGLPCQDVPVIWIFL